MNPPIQESIEEYTQKIIFEDLRKGDPHWDVQHTQAVVHYVKQILLHETEISKKIDSTVLILAAYGHDWGYSDFYIPGKPMPKKEYMEAKKTHAQRGCEKMEKLLKNSIYNSLTDLQKERIVHLILVHDNFNTVNQTDELVLMEADTLGGLNTDFVISNWTKEEDMQHMLNARKNRLPRFISDYGKEAFEQCYKKRWAKAAQK